MSDSDMSANPYAAPEGDIVLADGPINLADMEYLGFWPRGHSDRHRLWFGGSWCGVLWAVSGFCHGDRVRLGVLELEGGDAGKDGLQRRDRRCQDRGQAIWWHLCHSVSRVHPVGAGLWAWIFVGRLGSAKTRLA